LRLLVGCFVSHLSQWLQSVLLISVLSHVHCHTAFTNCIQVLHPAISLPMIYSPVVALDSQLVWERFQKSDIQCESLSAIEASGILLFSNPCVQILQDECFCSYILLADHSLLHSLGWWFGNCNYTVVTITAWSWRFSIEIEITNESRATRIDHDCTNLYLSGLQ